MSKLDTEIRTLEKVLEIFLQHSFTLLRLLRSSLLKFPVPSSDYCLSGSPTHLLLGNLTRWLPTTTWTPWPPPWSPPWSPGQLLHPFPGSGRGARHGRLSCSRRDDHWSVITNYIFLEHQNINSHHNHFHFLPTEIQRSIFSNASVRASNCNQTTI